VAVWGKIPFFCDVIRFHWVFILNALTLKVKALCYLKILGTLFSDVALYLVNYQAHLQHCKM
jgi:hypothetical protein